MENNSQQSQSPNNGSAVKFDQEFDKCLDGEFEQQSQMHKSITDITNKLCSQYPNSVSSNNKIDPKEHKIEMKRKIENIFADLMKQISEDKSPVLRIRDRLSWNNVIFGNRLCLKTLEESCTYTEVKFGCKKSLPKFSLIYFVLGKIYKLLTTDETCTKREIYYQNIDKISDQSVLDSALNDITCLLHCSLFDLNIYATSKGLVFGPLKIVTPKGEIDCGIDTVLHSSGTLIPNDVNNIIELKSDAKFVLLVEKDAVFEKLLDAGISKTLPSCIIVTGKGMPDVNTRVLLKKIWDMLSIPILALMDPDPYGIHIMCVYRFGSLPMSHHADLLAVPSIRWLGPFPSEVSKLCDRTSKLNDLDKAKLSDLMERPYIQLNEKIKFEIKFMLSFGAKAEIEDMELSPGYLQNVYLPHKIAAGDFI